MNPMDRKRGIDLAVTEAVSDLKRRSKKIKTSEEIAQVGAIAANGEKMIGDKIAEALRISTITERQLANLAATWIGR